LESIEKLTKIAKQLDILESVNSIA
jgi:hypothetical protein